MMYFCVCNKRESVLNSSLFFLYTQAPGYLRCCFVSTFQFFVSPPRGRTGRYFVPAREITRTRKQALVVSIEYYNELDRGNVNCVRLPEVDPTKRKKLALLFVSCIEVKTNSTPAMHSSTLAWCSGNGLDLAHILPGLSAFDASSLTHTRTINAIHSTFGISTLDVIISKGFGSVSDYLFTIFVSLHVQASIQWLKKRLFILS